MTARSRRTVGPDRIRLEVSVPCPEDPVDVPLEVCGRCERCRGFRIDPATQDIRVTCKVSHGNAARHRELSVERCATASHTPVSTIMSTHVLCLHPGLPIEGLGPVLRTLEVSGAPVVDEEGRPIGVLSQTDLLDRACRTGRGGEGGRAGPEPVVGSCMTSPAVTVPESASIAQVSALMAQEGIHRVVVVNAAGRVAGVVSPLDVLGWLARADGYVLGSRASRLPP